MPRARNIKHEFFKNEELADVSFIGRLLFIGLWTLADCKGRLEYRPRRIKAELFPYDDGLETDKELTALDKSGFISIYSVLDQRYIEIINFCKHQNPHKNERDKGSAFPEKIITPQVVELKGVEINPDLTGANRNTNGIDPADSLLLNPESLSLIPESGTTGSSNDTPDGGCNVAVDIDGYVFRGDKFNIMEKDFLKHRETYPNLNLINQYSQLDMELRDVTKKQVWGQLNAKLQYRNKNSQPGNQPSQAPKLSTVEQSSITNKKHFDELQHRIREIEARGDDDNNLGVVNH